MHTSKKYEFREVIRLKFEREGYVRWSAKCSCIYEAMSYKKRVLFFLNNEVLIL